MNIEHEEVEIDVVLYISKRYTHNGCYVDLELTCGQIIGATCISDRAFENITGISLSKPDEHYEFIIKLVQNADGVLEHAVVAEKVANAIIKGMRSDTEVVSIDMDVPFIGNLVVDVARIDDQKHVATGLPDKFSVEVKCVNDDSSVIIGKSWFLRDEVV